jgi:CheY-like chemotaxis protein
MSTLKKILMVDDDADLREALADQLVLTEEFDVFEAGDGAEGLAKAKEQHYDLVILDVGLPDMDGREPVPNGIPAFGAARHDPDARPQPSQPRRRIASVRRRKHHDHPIDGAVREERP